MKEDIDFEVVGSIVTEENGLKDTGIDVGTAYIDINYKYNDGNENDRVSWYAGTITVFRNGYIRCIIEDDEYSDLIYKDYVTIKGDNKEEKSYYIRSEDKDGSRWSRLRDFLIQNNLEIKYKEDLEIDVKKKEKTSFHK